MDVLLVHPVAERVIDRRVRTVDRQLGEVRPAQPAELGVDVGEQAHLQQRVVGDVDAGHQVSGVEGHLLGFGEVVRRVLVQFQQPQRLDGGQFLGHDLRRVQQVDASKLSEPSSGNTWTPSSHCG